MDETNKQFDGILQILRSLRTRIVNFESKLQNSFKLVQDIDKRLMKTCQLIKIRLASTTKTPDFEALTNKIDLVQTALKNKTSKI